MIWLALPGMIMVEAEWFAFEILTLMTSQFGTSYLAAQSILVTVTSTTFQIPFPVSIAASTRVANLIGAKLVDAAKTSARVVSHSKPPTPLFAGGKKIHINVCMCMYITDTNPTTTLKNRPSAQPS